MMMTQFLKIFPDAGKILDDKTRTVSISLLLSLVGRPIFFSHKLIHIVSSQDTQHVFCSMVCVYKLLVSHSRETRSFA